MWENDFFYKVHSVIVRKIHDYRCISTQFGRLDLRPQMRNRKRMSPSQL